jgi:hypothetical protein
LRGSPHAASDDAIDSEIMKRVMRLIRGEEEVNEVASA